MELTKVVSSYHLQWEAILLFQYDDTEMVGTPGLFPLSVPAILPPVAQTSTSSSCCWPNMCIHSESLPTNFYDVILLQQLLLTLYQGAGCSERTCTIKYGCERKQNAKNSMKNMPSLSYGRYTLVIT